MSQNPIEIQSGKKIMPTQWKIHMNAKNAMILSRESVSNVQ